MSKNSEHINVDKIWTKNQKDGSKKVARTAQPKQPYSIPSFKKLFPQTHTMRNFRNTKHWILQELQTSFRNKTIRNLSSHQLSPIETEVHALGLNFVPTPTTSAHHLVLKSANHLSQTMKKQFHFNLNSQQRSTLKKFGSNPDQVIKPFDKGSGICLMDVSLYISKIEEHLADPSTYKEVSSDPTQAIRNDVLSTLNYLYNTHWIDDVTRHHLAPPKPTRTPLFNGLLKVHKPNTPLLPIVSACDSPTNHL